MKNHFHKKVLQTFLILLMTLLTTVNYAQENTIKGKITSEDGNPLIGVSVIQKGTNNGAVTDFDGNYQINLKEGLNILVFSYLGFESIEKNAIGGTTVNIKMREDAETLDEVVVVGYGTQKKSDVTGAIGSIRSEELQDNVFTNVAETLQGRASGVYVTQASGEPGGGLDVNIRGINSLSGSGQPLYILDGIPLSLDTQAANDDNFNSTNPLSTLNPDDIEAIEILKDASSTAIYGSRASNGVIIITTKSAKTGKVSISGRVRTTVSNASTNFPLMNARQYNQVRNDWVVLDNPTQTYEELLAAGNIPYPDININGDGTDFIDALFRTGYTSDYSVSVSGGNKAYSQLLSLNFTDQEGIIIDSKFNRGNIRYNSKLNLTDRWSLTSNMQLNFIRNQRVVNSARTGLTGVFFNAFRINPNNGLFDEDGDFFDEDEDGAFVANPISNALYDDTILKNKDVILGINNTYRITNDLVWTTRFGLQHRLSNNESFADTRTARGRQDNGRLQISNAERTVVTVESFLNLDKQLGKHNFSALVGVGYEDFTTERDNHRYIDFTFDNLGANAIQLANLVSVYNSQKTNFTIQSGFFRLGYNYKNKYIFTVNGRADGTSKFINGDPWGFFPSAAIGWDVKKERFLRSFKPLNQLKFRASYGITGSQAGVAELASQAFYNIDRIGLSDDVLYTATFPGGIANTALTWETSKTFNLGLDFALLKNKIRGSVEYYERVTDDLLNNLPIPPQTGFGRVALNRGEIENTGIEVSLDVRVVNSKKFKWRSRFNWTTNKTILNDYGSQEFVNGPPVAANFFNEEVSRNIIGEEISQFYGYNIIGVVQIDDLVDYENGDFTVRNGDDGEPLYVTPNNNNRPGTWIFEDINGDGTINVEDKKILGNPNPDFFFGWNNNFTIGSFNVAAFFQGSIGNDILNVNKGFTGVGWSSGNSTEDWFEKRWTLDNQHNDVNFPSGQQFYTVRGPNSVYVEDGSFVRLRNLSVRYNIPNNKGKSNFGLTLTGTNLVTWTNYSGPDPEVNTNRGNAFSRGVDYSAYPRAKSLSLTLDLNF
jgi:TonB-linked SusC/RagA family outer membrane protein